MTLKFSAYDLAYTMGLAVAAPFWSARKKTRDKVLCALGQRMGHVSARTDETPLVLIHAVSLGEMNATRELVAQIQNARPRIDVVVSTTTVTGFNRGRELYAGRQDITVVRYPLDFTSAIVRFLDALHPALIVLMEGEIWPNFLLVCERRGIPVLLVNGRVSESAYARYRKITPITRPMLNRLTVVCAQDEVYAERFKSLGAPRDRVHITGTMKFDTASPAESVAGDQQLAAELGIVPGASPIWVCGSTGPGEEELILRIYRQLLKEFASLRLIVVPRKPERFDEVAGLIQAAGLDLLRRSSKVQSKKQPVILGDTMGELRKFYSLADVVFVGRSLVNLGSRQWGSDMIEPAALAKPVVIGPWTQNFAEAVRKFKLTDAIVEVRDEVQLLEQLSRWLKNPTDAAAMGGRAQQVVRSNQGATARHVEMIFNQLSMSDHREAGRLAPPSLDQI